MSDSLWPHESQQSRPPCPSPIPGVHSDSRPSSQWCHPAISSSVVPISSCPQSLPASESFPMSQLFAWDGQSTRVSALASFLPKKSQDKSWGGGGSWFEVVVQIWKAGLWVEDEKMVDTSWCHTGRPSAAGPSNLKKKKNLKENMEHNWIISRKLWKWKHYIEEHL